jgi:hypothetical protein
MAQECNAGGRWRSGNSLANGCFLFTAATYDEASMRQGLRDDLKRIQKCIDSLLSHQSRQKKNGRPLGARLGSGTEGGGVDREREG